MNNEVSGDVELGRMLQEPPFEEGQGLISNIDEPNELKEESRRDQVVLKPIPKKTCLECIVAMLAVCAVLCSLSAMILEAGAHIVIGAGLLSMLVSPIGYWQQVRLTNIRILLETERKLREEKDHLLIENRHLSRNIGALSASVVRLQDVADALNVLTQQAGLSVGTLAKQVADQRQMLISMKTNLKAQVIDNLLSLAFAADLNEDSKIDQAEAEKLLRVIQEMPGVQVNQEMFLTSISGQSSDKVIDIIEDLLKEDLPIQDRMFTFTQNT